jgi:hypothetical protein
MDFFHKDKVEKEMKTTWGLLARRRGVFCDVPATYIGRSWDI